MKKLLTMLLILLTAFNLASCGISTNETAESSETKETSKTEGLPPTEVQVFIASSLENAFLEIVPLYNEQHPNIRIVLNADSSGTLLSQIEEGFSCDIFFSADAKQIDQALEEGLAVEGSRIDLLKNQLVLITYKNSGTAVRGLENLSDAASIALADGSVPAGKYTRAALQSLGVLNPSLNDADITAPEISDALSGVEINETSNVSKTLEAVAEGSNEIGTVYYSDAYSRIDTIDILEMIDPSLTGDILYPVVRIYNAEADEEQNLAAEDFLAFLQTPEVMEIFQHHMFLANS